MTTTPWDVWLIYGASLTFQLNQEPFEVTADGWSGGAVSVRRDWIKSPYIEGASLGNLNPPRDIVQQKIKLLVGGASQSAIQSNLTNLEATLVPPGFTEFHFYMNSIEYAWNVVGPPDYSFLPTVEMTIGRRAPVEITFYRQPTPKTGPL